MVCAIMELRVTTVVAISPVSVLGSIMEKHV